MKRKLVIRGDATESLMRMGGSLSNLTPSMHLFFFK